MDALTVISAFAGLLLDFARLGLVAVVVVWVMYQLAKAMQSAARRRMIAATKRGYANLATLAGKPVAPPAERRNRTKRAA